MVSKLAAWAVTHIIMVSFIIFHVIHKTNPYVLGSHLLELLAFAALSSLIPKRYENYYFAFLLYYFTTTSLTFNNWILALPNYLAKEDIVWGTFALVAALISIIFGFGLRKFLMLCSFISGIVYHYVKDGLILAMHLSFALTFILSLFVDLHFIVWLVNYITYALRRLRGTV